MILSMTGYGAAEHVESGTSYALELKSVNHRYLKLTIRLPELLQHCESSVEKIIRESIGRGSISASLRIRGDAAEAAGSINVGAAQHYVNQLSQVKVADGVSTTIDLGAIAGLPGVCETLVVDDEMREQQTKIVEDLTARACDVLLAMRKTEGVALRDDILQCCVSVREHLADIQSQVPKVLDEYHERLRTKVNTLMQKGGFELEENGLMREIAIYAERCDISEEVTRLNAHLDQFGKLCDSKKPVGRTLDFLSQELLREANTIASKSNDTLIARTVVSIKGLIDRLKEQVQNVE
ncbi:MAG: YicC/YloC family endoribonuclease [Planctomycetota bacterium]|jgi:uncharacterized protein (TIGR00255 family)